MSDVDEAWDELGPPPPPPPPPSAHGAATASPRPRRSRARTVLTVLVSFLVGFVAGSGLSDVLEVPELPWRSAAAVQSERDAGLVDLLEGIVVSESIMLAFNDRVADELEGATDEAAALAAIAAAAAAGADGLRAERPVLVAPLGDRVVDGVRDVYVPHLDSWIDYLAALEQGPGLLFTRDDQQPYLLRINATAEAFADALEELLSADPSPEVAGLAEGILDAGFRSEREADV